MSGRSWPTARSTRGFTLIEVVGALVIFSLGVLMVMQVSDALGRQIRYAGARSTLVVLANEHLDSLETEPFPSLTSGTTVDSVIVLGITYQTTVTITEVTPVLTRIDVAMAAVDTNGPAHAVTSYVSEPW